MPAAHDPYPTLKERIARALTAAGFADRQDHLPVKTGGGTFAITSGAGARVEVSWWDVTDAERRGLLEAFAAALREAGFTVTDQGHRLYVAEPE